MFAVHFKPSGRADYAGKVLSDNADTVAIQLIDPMMTLCGVWQITDRVQFVPKAECQYFLTEVGTADAINKANEFAIKI